MGYLTLSRKAGEKIRIGNDITIVVVQVERDSAPHNDKVRIAIEAPLEVPVHREEVYKAIHREEKGEQSDGQGQ